MRVESRYLGVAIGVSLLLHGLLLQWRWAVTHPTPHSTSHPLSIWLRATPKPETIHTPSPPLTAPPKPTEPAKPIMAPKPLAASAATVAAVSREPTPHKPQTVASPPDNPAAPVAAPSSEVTLPAPVGLSLHDRATASVKDVTREMQDEDKRGHWMVKPKEMPSMLAGLPQEVQTQFQKSFDKHLAELVILSTREHQEGNNRVTVYHTNKGDFCAYESLVSPYFMRDMPQATKFGTCGPQT